MAMDFLGLSVGMGYTDETVIGGGALKGKNCVVSNIEEVADGVNVTFQWTLDDGTVQTETVLLPKGTQGEAGVDGKSAYEIWLEAGNTGTEEDFLISLVGEKGADGTMTFEDLTEEQKAQLKGENGKSAYQIWLDAGNTGSEEEFLESLKGDGADVEFDDVPTENSENAIKSGAVYEALEGKQNATIFVDATMSTVKDSWDNYLLDVDEEYRYSKVQDMLVNGKTVILRVKVDGVLVELPCVSYESYTNATLTFAAPYYNSSTGEKGSYIAFCASTVGWKLGIKVVKEASSTDMSPFIIKSAYTEDSNGFTIDTKTTTPALWDDWYPAFEAGRPVYWDLHKHSIDSNKDVIRLYPHSHGIYYESTGTKECQFTSIGGYPNYDSRNNSTKYFYIGWFRSGSAPMSNYKFVKQYKINEIPTGGTTRQALVKKSDTNYDVEWADVGGDEIIHTDLSGNLEGITTVLDLANALLEEYRAEKKLVRFESGSLSNTNLTDLPQAYGYLTIKVGGTNIVEVTFAYSNLGFKKMYYGFLNRTAGNELFDTLTWEKVATKSDLDALQTQIDELKSKIN